MSHRTSLPPPSPALSPSLYSGMSSLQISHSGSGHAPESSYHPSASQPQKVLLKGSKAARHQSGRNEHASSSISWKDPRQAVAASAGRKRIVKDDAFYRNVQSIWSPFPVDARPSARKERDVMLRAVIDHVAEENIMADIHSESEQRVAALEAASAAHDARLLKLEETMQRCGQYTAELVHLRRARHMAAQQKQSRVNHPNHPVG